MGKSKMPDVFINPEYVKKEAQKKGLTLDDRECLTIAGALYGTLTIALQRQIDRLVVRQEIEAAETLAEGWDVVLENLDLLSE